MIHLWNTKDDNSEEKLYSRGSLNHISSFTNERDQSDSGQNFRRMRHATMDCFVQTSTQKKKLVFNDQTFAKMTSTYMKRGSLDTDLIDIKNEQLFSEKDFVLKEILRRNVVDVTREEDSNMAIYILRKVQRNVLEMQFLKKIIENISIFKKNPDLSKNCSNQILTKITHSFFNKNQVIFNYDYKSETTEQPEQEDEKSFKRNSLKSELNKNPIEIPHKNKFATAGVHPHLKRLKSQENDLHEFDLESGAYEPPKSPLKKNKLILKPNRSQSFSDNEDDEYLQQKKKQENKKSIQANYPDFDIIKELKQGESFGEIAILTGEKRTATMICSEDTHLLALSRKGFDAILGLYKKFIMSETVVFLKRFPFLKAIPPSQLLSLFQLMKEEKYVQGNTIYCEKDICNQIYFIKSGEVEITKEYQIIEQKEENSYFPESNSTTDMKAFNLTKKKNKQRVRLYQVGANSFFGASEIMKQLPNRETLAKCISEEATIFSIEKKKLFVFMKVQHYFQAFVREIQIKMDWEDERDKNIQDKVNQNKVLINQNIQQGRNQRSEDNLRRTETINIGKDTESNFSTTTNSQVSAAFSFQSFNQKKNNDMVSSSQLRTEQLPKNEYFSSQSLKQIPHINGFSQYESAKSYQIEQQVSKDSKSKLPSLQSKIIETGHKHNSRSNSMNQLMYSQNKPIIETLVLLKHKGFDITQLSKLSHDEIKEMTRKVHKNIAQVPKSRKSLLLRDDQQSDNNQQRRDIFALYKKSVKSDEENELSMNIPFSTKDSNEQDTQADQNPQSTSNSFYQKFKVTNSARNADNPTTNQFSSKNVGNQFAQPSNNLIIQSNKQLLDSPNSMINKIQIRNTPPKTFKVGLNSFTPDLKKDITPYTTVSSNSNYSIFNKSRSNTEQFSSIKKKVKQPNYVCKGSTVHNQREQQNNHYKFEEDLISKNQKQNNDDIFKQKQQEKERLYITNNLQALSNKMLAKNPLQNLTYQKRLSLNEQQNIQFPTQTSPIEDKKITFNIKSYQSSKNINL